MFICSAWDAGTARLRSRITVRGHSLRKGLLKVVQPTGDNKDKRSRRPFGGIGVFVVGGGGVFSGRKADVATKMLCGVTPRVKHRRDAKAGG